VVAGGPGAVPRGRGGARRRPLPAAPDLAVERRARRPVTRPCPPVAARPPDRRPPAGVARPARRPV